MKIWKIHNGSLIGATFHFSISNTSHITATECHLITTADRIDEESIVKICGAECTARRGETAG